MLSIYFYISIMRKKILILLIFFFSCSIFYYLGYKNFGTKFYTNFKCNFINGEKKKVYCISFNAKNLDNLNEKSLKRDLLKNYNADIFKTSLNKKYFLEALGFNNLSNEKDLECNETESLYSECFIKFKNSNKIYFYKKNNNKKKTLVFLHGHNITTNDYISNNKINELSENYNTIIFSLFSNVKDAQIINNLLYLNNQNYYGLVVKSICEVLNEYDFEYFIIGHSNGALISKFLNSYCDNQNIKLIIYNDYFPLFKGYFKQLMESGKPIQLFTYELQFLIPLYYYYSDAFFLLTGNSKTIIYQDMKLFKNSNLDLCLKKSEFGKEENTKNIYFIENKQGHNLDFFLYKKILNQEDFINKTYSVDKECLDEKLNTK